MPKYMQNHLMRAAYIFLLLTAPILAMDNVPDSRGTQRSHSVNESFNNAGASNHFSFGSFSFAPFSFPQHHNGFSSSR